MSKKGFSKSKDWQKVYQLPLHNDKYGAYAWTKNGTMALMFNRGVSKENREDIIACINGEKQGTIKGLTNDNQEFYQDDQEIFCVRGWGHLTGVGALNLPIDKAVNVQDGFIKHILERLTSKEEKL